MSDHTIIVILVIKTFFVYFFFISFASVRSLPFCPSLCPSLHEMFNDISNFLEMILSLSHPIVFLYIFIVHLRRPSYLSLLFSGTLHSIGYIFPFHPCFSFLFFTQLFVKPTQTTTLPSCISFSLGWFWSLSPVQCYKSLPIVFQVLCLPDLIPWTYLSPPVYNCKGFNLGHTWMA